MPRSTIELYTASQKFQETAQTFVKEPEWHDYFMKLSGLYFKAAETLGPNDEIRPEVQNEISSLKWPVMRIVRPASVMGYSLKK